MSDEKTNASVLEDSTKESPSGNDVPHQDKLILLDNGSLLITRVLTKAELPNPTFICVYRPFEVFNDMDTGEVLFRDWIPESIDEFFYVPVTKIINVSQPDPYFLITYHNQLHYIEVDRVIH